MELIVDSKLMKRHRMNDIMGEANELIAIFTSSILTAKQHTIKNHKSKIALAFTDGHSGTNDDSNFTFNQYITQISYPISHI